MRRAAPRVTAHVTAHAGSPLLIGLMACSLAWGQAHDEPAPAQGAGTPSQASSPASSPNAPAGPHLPALPEPPPLRAALPPEGGRPVWEAGVAVLGLHAPDYPAARSHRWRGAVSPIVVYRGHRMRVDDDGVRGRLVNHGGLELDVSGAASFSARESEARQGMPPLDYTFELGPQVLYRWRLTGGHQISTHLKLRAVMSTDWRHVQGRGAVLEPEVRWQQRGWPDSASGWAVVGQAVWATEALHDYFYQVDPAYATPSRAAFDAQPGYFGSSLRASYNRRLSDTTRINLGVSLNSHRGAANAASPLFQRTETAGVYLAVIWIPWRSTVMTAP